MCTFQGIIIGLRYNRNSKQQKCQLMKKLISRINIIMSDFFYQYLCYTISFSIDSQFHHTISILPLYRVCMGIFFAFLNLLTQKYKDRCGWIGLLLLRRWKLHQNISVKDWQRKWSSACHCNVSGHNTVQLWRQIILAVTWIFQYKYSVAPCTQIALEQQNKQFMCDFLWKAFRFIQHSRTAAANVLTEIVLGQTLLSVCCIFASKPNLSFETVSYQVDCSELTY